MGEYEKDNEQKFSFIGKDKENLFITTNDYILIYAT